MSKNASGKSQFYKMAYYDRHICMSGRRYSGSYGNWSRVALWSCGPGKPSTPTVKGEFTIYGRGKSFLVAGLIHVGIIRSFMETICSIQCFIIVVV